MGSHLRQLQCSVSLQYFPSIKMHIVLSLCQAAPAPHVTHPAQRALEKSTGSPSPRGAEHAATEPRCKFPGQHAGCQIPSRGTWSWFSISHPVSLLQRLVCFAPHQNVLLHV